MALSDLTVFSEFAYEAVTEIMDQQIADLVAQTDGAIVISSDTPTGDFNETAFFAKIAGGLVRRRNAYGSGAIGTKKLSMLNDVEVKVASGTPVVDLDPSALDWIQLNPEVAGATVARQLAPDMLADLINSGVGALRAALAGEAEVNRDITDATEVADRQINFKEMTKTAALFGDRSGAITSWLMHSAPMHGLYVGNLQNTERLFTFGNINVIRDPFGRLMIQTDSPSLVQEDGGENNYNVMGLTNSAITITRNADWYANEETKNGEENIVKTYQAQWSNNYGLKGFAWDKANGGKSPNDAALMNSESWDRIATSHKDLAGVMLTGRTSL
jgi:hypothetical protein